MQETKKSFNHYKLHTQYSICEGAIKIEDLEKFCKNSEKLLCTSRKALDVWIKTPKVIAPVNKPGPISRYGTIIIV